MRINRYYTFIYTHKAKYKDCIIKKDNYLIKIN